MVDVYRRFTLVLAGASWSQRPIDAFGALLGIGLSALIGTMLVAVPGAGLLLLAPMGASAVLLFVVPSSPLAQPWPIVGGNVVSAVVGLTVAGFLGHGALAGGVAVGAAILAMSVLRCLHPPGGGTVLLPVIGGPALLAQGYGFALVPTALNAVALVAIGLVFHRFSGHSYPHRPLKMPGQPPLLREDIDAAIEESGETFDVSREDLEALLQRAERHAQARRKRR